MERVFVDSDIVLDVLAKRSPFYEYAAHLFSLADQRKVGLGISSLCFSNINYLLSKQIGSSEARKALIKLKTLVTVLAVDDKVIELSLASNFTDFEDAIQYFCAIENGYKTLLTRNLKDYKKANIPVMTAESYLKQ